MSKRKGMSAEDKRKTILKIYHDKKEPFNLREIETIGAKQGVVQQTIKDVNQSLCDDFLVYSKAGQDRKNEQEKISGQIARIRTTIDNSKASIKENRILRCSDGRAEKMKRYEELIKHEGECDAILLAGKANDPKEVNRVIAAGNNNMEQANRWTDNMWTVKKFLTSKKGMNGKEADKMLKIDNAFDYVSHADLPKEKGGKKK